MKYMNFSSLNISEKVNESYVTFLGTSDGLFFDPRAS